MKYDVIIVGAGVAGLMTTIELAKAGKQCCLIDKGKVGLESSWAGGGILSPLSPWRYPDAVNALAHWSQQHYPDYFQHLQQQTGIDPEWLRCGYLLIESAIDEPKLARWSSQFGQPYQILNAEAGLQHIAPRLAGDFNQAIWLPNIGQIRNPRLLKALYAHVIQLEQTILEDTSVEPLIAASNTIDQISTSHGQISADQVLITAGAWSSELFDEGVIKPPVKPVKGQMIQYQWQAGEILPITQFEGHYVIPRADGKLLVGSTLEDTGFDKSTDDSVAKSLAEAASAMYPCLKHQPIINHWAGLRPGNERQTPYICQHPKVENLYFNAGHFRNGIVLGLASARLCADLMLNQETILPPEPYQL